MRNELDALYLFVSSKKFERGIDSGIASWMPRSNVERVVVGPDSLLIWPASAAWLVK